MSVTAQELLRRCLEGGGDPNLAAALATTPPNRNERSSTVSTDAAQLAMLAEGAKLLGYSDRVVERIEDAARDAQSSDPYAGLATRILAVLSNLCAGLTNDEMTAVSDSLCEHLRLAGWRPPRSGKR